MKRLYNSLALPVMLAVLALAGCKKDDALISVKNGTYPTLTASTAAPVMDPKKENDHAIKFTWTNPEYIFTTGISSQNVQYSLEIDTVGSNFSNPRKGVVVISRELSQSFTAYELNVVLSGANTMNLPPDKPYNFEARIVSSINGAVPLNSNIVKFTATPFSPPPVVDVPTDGTLWVVGDAFPPNNWNNNFPPPADVVNKFTRLSKTLYELVITIPGGGNYKLIQTPGNWGTQYTLDAGTWDAGTFRKKDADPGFTGPLTAGKYKFTFNFQTGKYTVVKQ